MSIEFKEFLGVGWEFPVNVVEKKINMARYEADIKQSIILILSTAKGERVMRPDFGCGIHNYVFETISMETLTNIETSIREALFQWEPRIEVLMVQTDTSQIDAGKLIINLDYRILSVNSRNNLVYDFYLKEGA